MVDVLWLAFITFLVSPCDKHRSPSQMSLTEHFSAECGLRCIVVEVDTERLGIMEYSAFNMGNWTEIKFV